MSYIRFPKSGTMQNGNVYRAPHLECNRVGKEFIVLPTPTVSDSKGSGKSRYFQSQNYHGNFREYIRDGEHDPIYPNPALSEALMTFPTGWSELRPTETQ
nr:hypothetical protein [Pontibacter qinzhouensis]